jgi:hypothetical protein
LGLKGQECLYKTFFCQAISQAAVAIAIFNKWQWKKASRCSPCLILGVYHTIDLLFLPQSEIRAGKLLVDSGHLQEEGVGVAPTIATEELAATVL